MTEDEEQQLRERVARLEGRVDMLSESLGRTDRGLISVMEELLNIAKDSGRNRE